MTTYICRKRADLFLFFSDSILQWVPVAQTTVADFFYLNSFKLHINALPQYHSGLKYFIITFHKIGDYSSNLLNLFH